MGVWTGVCGSLPGETMLWAWDATGSPSPALAWCMRMGSGESRVGGAKESALKAWHAIVPRPEGTPPLSGSPRWFDLGLSSCLSCIVSCRSTLLQASLCFLSALGLAFFSSLAPAPRLQVLLFTLFTRLSEGKLVT